MSKKKIDKSFDKREEDEKKEGYETVKTDLPSDRFQAAKQIVKPDEMGVTSKSIPGDIGNTGLDAAKQLRSKLKIRPDVSVDDLGGKQVGGVPLAVETGLRNAAGARSLSPADDMSRTPYSSGNYRPETRYGKKRSEDLFELDNTAIEQVVPIVDDLPDLAKDPESKVGYNGRQQFKQVRQKKNYVYNVPGTLQSLKLPQQLLNDASLDFDESAKVVYTCGQVVTPISANGDHAELPAQSDYPTWDGAAALTGDSIMHKSNYMPSALNFTINGGHITAVSIDETRFVADASATVRDEANMNWQVDTNNVAKTMIKLQKELGRETTDKWSALGYVITQPYEYNMLLHDIEASAGAIGAIAYRSAVSSLAYQRNITKKDGINPQRNAIKMILEGYAGVLANNDRNTISDLNFNHMIFNKSAYRNGSVAAMIDMFDSTGKYKTKADILGLQRSLGLHLSQADNNLNPLHCKPEFIKAIDKAHMFSTVDGQYNPFLSIFTTKSIRIINPLSLNRFLIGWKNPALLTDAERLDPRRDLRTGTYAQYMYSYSDLRNKYETKVQHPTIEGLLKWMMEHEGAIVSTYGNGNVTIPFYFDMQAPNMLSFLLCAAAQDIAFERNICFRDVLFAGEQETYIWDDLKPLKELNPLYSSQLRIGRYDEPLTLGKLAPDTCIRLMYGDHRQLKSIDRDQVEYFEPWFFNEEGFDKTAGGNYVLRRGFFADNTPFNFSYPSIRDGVRHEHVDIIKSMSPLDVMLSLDRKLDIMKFATLTQATINGTKVYDVLTPIHTASVINNKIKVSSIRYDANSDGRLITTYSPDAGSVNHLNTYALGLYCIPKEIGYIDDDFTSLHIITEASYDSSHDAVDITETVEPFTGELAGAGDAYYYNGGVGRWLTSYRVEADALTNGSVDRSAALTSTFYRFFAAPTAQALNLDFCNATGIVPCRNVNNGNPLAVYGVYNLGSDNLSTSVLDGMIDTDSMYMWTLLQRYFMPVNPFANAAVDDSATHGHDPFEGSYLFGVCGFLAADYTQWVLERLSMFDQLGLDFTEDINIKTSLIFR